MSVKYLMNLVTLPAMIPIHHISRSFTALFALSLLSLTTLSAQQQEPKLDPQGEVRRLDSVYRQGLQSRATSISNEDIRGREAWFYFQRRYPYDVIPAGVRADAVRQVRALQERIDMAKAAVKSSGASVMAGSSWESIGPGNIAGRIKAIAVHPTQSGTIFIGAAAGGVWKNTGEGNAWTTTWNTETAMAVNALAIDYSSPNIVYAGTGEIFSTNSLPSASLSYLGDGIFKSTDGGNTWKNSGPTNVSVGAFSKLYVHRQNSNIVYASAVIGNGGFYRSTNAGASWSSALSSGAIYDMSVNPLNSNTIYLATNNALRKSTDAGLTFKAITSGINVTNGTRMSVAVAPSDTNIVYAMISRAGAANNRNFCDIYKSTNGGTSWQLKSPTDASSPFVTGSFFNDQGYYDQCLAVHPTNPNVVLAGGIDVFQTIDGGASWDNVTKSYTTPQDDPNYVHPDQHILQFDPSNPDVVYLGNDGGCYYSIDAGSSWERLSLNLPITQFYQIDVDPTRVFRVYGGTQDNGSIGAIGTATTANWTAVNGGDGFYVAVDQTDPNIVYAEVYYGTLSRINVNSPKVRTRIDGGIPSGSQTDADDGLWSTPIAMSPVDKTSLYSGRRRFLYRTTNPRSSSNPTWTKLIPGNGNAISTIGLSPLDAKQIAIGTIAGEVRTSIDNGANWRGATGIPGRFVTDLEYDPVDQNRIYATVSGTSGAHVFRSNNGGTSFSSVSSNLPTSLPVNAIQIDPNDNTHLFVGTDAGVFISLDGGGFWFPFNEGLPLAPVTTMKIHSGTRTLVAGTHGRSAYQISIDNPKVQPLLVAPVGGQPFTTPGKMIVRWAGFDCPVRILISYDNGANYSLVLDNVTGDSATIDLPFVKTNTARVKVESTCDSRMVESGNLTLNPQSNATELGTRGVKSEAIAVRNNYVWATQRGSDTIYKFLTPGLLPTSKQFVIRSGFTGTVRDLAYDATADLFYALVTASDFSGAKVYRMDTSGAAQGEVTLPVTTVSGIAMTPQGLALITPGAQGTIYIINPADGTVISQSQALQGAVGEQRAGLEWDGLLFVQGVSDAQPSGQFSSEIQRERGPDTARVVQRMPVVLPSGNSMQFFGFAYNPNAGDQAYYATDTSGNLYRFTFQFAGVGESPAVVNRARTATIGMVTPNPFREAATIGFELKNRQQVSLELYTTAGERVMKLFEGTLEAGSHTVPLDGKLLSSGIYYISLTNGSGERDVRSVVMMK
jgi:hypothetical protein